MITLVLSFLRRYGGALIAWFDSDAPLPPSSGATARWLRCLPFIFLHLGCLTIPLVGTSWPAFWCAVFLYCFRVFSLTAFYHRYFSHRSFKTSRFWQFIFAVCGMTAAQRGPLWWAAHHRHHHQYSDTEHDSHSPHNGGFWHSHLGWFTQLRHFTTDYSRIPDLARYRELVILNRFDSLVPIALLVSLYFIGEALAPSYPSTSGWQFVVWGGCLSTSLSTMLLFSSTPSAICTVRCLIPATKATKKAAIIGSSPCSPSAKGGITITTVIPPPPGKVSFGGK